MDEHAFPPTGFAVARLGCTLQLYASNSSDYYMHFSDFFLKEALFILISGASGSLSKDAAACHFNHKSSLLKNLHANSSCNLLLCYRGPLGRMAY